MPRLKGMKLPPEIHQEIKKIIEAAQEDAERDLIELMKKMKGEKRDHLLYQLDTLQLLRSNIDARLGYIDPVNRRD